MLEPLPTLRAPEKPVSAYARGLPAREAFTWLAAGWNDLRRNPGPSLVYGVFLVVLSYAALWALATTGLLYLCFLYTSDAGDEEVWGALGVVRNLYTT